MVTTVIAHKKASNGKAYEVERINGHKHRGTGRREGDARAAFLTWRTIAEDVRRTRDFELTTEEFAPIVVAYREMKRAGVPVDPMAESLIIALSRQAQHTEEDPDSDGSDGDEPDMVGAGAQEVGIIAADRHEVLAGFRKAEAELSGKVAAA